MPQPGGLLIWRELANYWHVGELPASNASAVLCNTCTGNLAPVQRTRAETYLINGKWVRHRHRQERRMTLGQFTEPKPLIPRLLNVRI
jgi:hypothetical protein